LCIYAYLDRVVSRVGSEGDQEGVEVMMQMALKLLSKEEGRSQLAILGADAEAEDDGEATDDS
jgi:hypothetical protein